MRVPMMNNYMTQTLILNYLTGGSCFSSVLQTNGHVFSSPVQKSIKLFGITVDDRLCL